MNVVANYYTALTYPHRNGCGQRILHYSTDRLCIIVLYVSVFMYTRTDYWASSPTYEYCCFRHI